MRNYNEPGNFKRVPQNRKPGTGAGRTMCPWRAGFHGARPFNRAVIVGWLIALQHASDEELLHHRDWANRFGLTPEYLTRRLRQAMPGLIEYYQEYMGKPWDAKLFHNRLYVCYWKANQKGPRDVYSSEHPKVHAVLSPQIDFVRRHFGSACPVPLGAPEFAE